MRVFYYNNTVVNVDECCPSVQKMIDNGAEEIPVEIFDGKEQYADSENTVKVDDEWVFNDANCPTLEDCKAAKKEVIQLEKKRVRDGGVDVGGVLFDTDIEARMSYADLRRKIDSDPDYTVVNWKASGDIFVEMNATKLAQVEEAGEQLLADVFTWQATQNAAIDAVTNMEELLAVGMEYVSPGVDLTDK